MTTLDVIQTEIIRNQLVSATDEMAKTLIRTAFSPLLYEIQDFGTAIMSPTGQMWAETPGVIVFSQALPQTIAAGIAHWKGDFSDGDVLIVNDPFETGTHISDTTVYLPVFFAGELVAFCGMAAHWADIGGTNAGGWGPGTTDVYQEGLCFRHQKIIAAGVPNQALWDLIADNVRVPTIVHGDLEAQIASCRKGASRVLAVCEKYGRAALVDGMAHVIAATDRSMRAAIAKLPDGEYSSSIRLDSAGSESDQEVLFKLKVTISGERLLFSTEGSSATAQGPVNLPEIGTRATLASSLKGLLMPFDASNAGHAQCLEFDIPPLSVVSPVRPAPSDSYGYAVICLMELMFRCFALIVPQRCSAGGAQLTGMNVFRIHEQEGRAFVMVEPLHVGNGALHDGDGPTNQLVGCGDLPNGPVEVLETRFPVRVERLEYAAETSGAGKFRGGMGVRKDYRLLESGCSITLILENTKDLTGTGVAGGASAAPGKIIVNPGTPDERNFERRLANIGPFPAGTVLRVVTGGGGGWGHAHEREPLHVLSEVQNGFLDPQQAAAMYGVSIAEAPEGWVIDRSETARLRDQRIAATG